MASPRGRREIVPLTGLRGVAALWVFGYHLVGSLEEMSLGIPLRPLRQGYLGVDVFFVLSGFVLALNYGDRIRSARDYGEFVQNRIARIYPLHAVTLAALVGVAVLIQHHGIRVTHPEHFQFDHHLALHVFLLHAWGFEQDLRWNLPSWSISAELFAYLLFPAFCWMAWRLKRPKTLILAVFGSVLFSVGLLRILGYPSLHVPKDHVLLRIGGEFLAGCLLYRLYQMRQVSGGAGAPAWSLLALGALVVGASGHADPLMPWAACLLIYALAVHPDGVVGRLLSLGPVAWLGTISYSIYLTHLPLISVWRRVVPLETRAEAEPSMGMSLILVILALALAVAAASYYAIEAPARRWLRRHGPQE